MQNRTRAATRWFATYALLMGLAAFALVVAVEVFFPSGLTRVVAAAAWSVAVGLLGWWADSHGAYPQRAARRLIVATALWFGAYLLLVGPLVRWQAGQSPGLVGRRRGRTGFAVPRGRLAGPDRATAPVTHPRHRLDPVVHAPARFSVMAALVAADRVEFRFVRDTVELTDSALSQHLTKLEQAGYVKVTKGQVGRRPRTWIAATRAGRTAFRDQLAVLNGLAASATGRQDDDGLDTEVPGSA